MFTSILLMDLMCLFHCSSQERRERGQLGYELETLRGLGITHALVNDSMPLDLEGTKPYMNIYNLCVCLYVFVYARVFVLVVCQL